MKKLLIVNPGSTSTKVAVYYGSERKFSETISHPAQELQPFANVLDQAAYRAGVIARCLEQAVLSGQVDAIVLTGGVIYSQAFRQLLLSRHLLSGPGDLQARRGGDGQPGLLPQRRPHRRAPAQGI